MQKSKNFPFQIGLIDSKMTQMTKSRPRIFFQAVFPHTGQEGDCTFEKKMVGILKM